MVEDSLIRIVSLQMSSKLNDTVLGSDGLRDLVPFSRSSFCKTAHPHTYVEFSQGNRRAV